MTMYPKELFCDHCEARRYRFKNPAFATDRAAAMIDDCPAAFEIGSERCRKKPTFIVYKMALARAMEE